MGEEPRSAILDLAGVGEGEADSWPDGGDSGGLRSDKKVWSGAAEGVRSLQGAVKTATVELAEKQQGFSAFSLGVTGFETGSAQRGVYETWQRYLDLVGRESGEVAGKLEQAGSDHYKNDEAVGEAFRQYLTRPEEPGTPPGGQPPAMNRLAVRAGDHQW